MKTRKVSSEARKAFGKRLAALRCLRKKVLLLGYNRMIADAKAGAPPEIDFKSRGGQALVRTGEHVLSGGFFVSVGQFVTPAIFSSKNNYQ